MRRIPSGIKGLDELIEGGFVEGSVNLISGPPGSCKTIFGLQYILNGVSMFDDEGIYISLEEPNSSIKSAAEILGLPLSSEKARLVDLGEMREAVSYDVEKSNNLASFTMLRDFLEKNAPKRLVIDSITALKIHYDEQTFRREFFAFGRFLKKLGVTSILISETCDSGISMENFVSDALVFLNYENIYGEYRRTLTVYKMRLTRHDPYKHPFILGKGGLDVIADEVIRE